MPRYYCDYCDTYLTHDSPSVRKQHNSGYKHKANVRSYYQKFEEQQTQTLIDQKIKEHLGQAAAYQLVGAAYNQHFAAFPGQQPRLPVIPPPILPIPGTAPFQLVPGVRPPVLPMPVPGALGYGIVPMMPPVVGQPPAVPTLAAQANMLNPPTLNVPTTVPGGVAALGSNGAPSSVTQAMYQANPTGSTAPSANTTAGGYNYAQAPEASR